MVARIAAVGFAALLAPGLLVGGWKRPGDDRALPSKVVSPPVAHGDLDLARAADVGVRMRRIEAAAMVTCGEEPHRGLDVPSQYRVCMRVTVDNAVASLGGLPLAPGNQPMNTQDSRHRPAFAGL
jgi:UrcA family protein